MKVKINSFCRVRRGASPRPISDQKYFGGSVGWIRISDVTNSKKFLRHTEQYLSPLGESKSVRVDKGDLIMSICGTVGKPIIIDIPACIHDGFVQLFDLEDADNVYLYYALQFSEEEFQNMGQPGTQVNLNTSLVGNHRIFFPSLLVQRRIATILSSVDRQIEQTDAIIGKYQHIKQGMMYDIFTRGIDPATGKLRLSSQEAPELYKESPLGLVPKEWSVKKMESIISLMTNGFVGVATPFYAQGDEGVLYLYGNNVRSDSIEVEAVERVKRSFHNKLKKSQLKAGDMLTVQSGHIGVSAVVPNGFPEANCHALIITRFIVGYHPDFFSAYINSDLGMARMSAIFVGSTIKHVNVKEFKGFLVPSPDYKEQIKISKNIEEINSLIKKEQGILQILKQLKKGLMADILSGKVKVPVDNQNNLCKDKTTNMYQN